MHFLPFYSEDKNKDQAMTNITKKETLEFSRFL